MWAEQVLFKCKYSYADLDAFVMFCDLKKGKCVCCYVIFVLRLSIIRCTVCSEH